MSIIEKLTQTAQSDTELLIKNDRLGDDVRTPRLVDFLFTAEDRESADALAEFVAGNQYGESHIEPAESGFRVLAVIEMPITQHLICSVSGLMECLAAVFKVEYDGWGCVIQQN